MLWWHIFLCILFDSRKWACFKQGDIRTLLKRTSENTARINNVNLPTPTACTFDIAELTEEGVNNVSVLRMPGMQRTLCCIFCCLLCFVNMLCFLCYIFIIAHVKVAFHKSSFLYLQNRSVTTPYSSFVPNKQTLTVYAFAWFPYLLWFLFKWLLSFLVSTVFNG
jgi:hypothetical protein